MNMLFREREYFSKGAVKISAPQWLWSGFYQGCADLHTLGQKWVWNSPVQIGLRILTGKKHPQLKLQRLLKVWKWTFRWLVHQINSLYEALKLKQNFRKNKVITSKALFFVIGPSCTPHSVCLNVGFWLGSFVWKCCVFNPSTFN